MPCAPAVTPITISEITYVTGGIGLCEASAIREMAKEYSLALVFIQKLGSHEAFLADVKVQIQDRHQLLLLDVTTEGPYLLMNVPQGKYLIIAEYNGDTKQQWVNVKLGKTQQVVFWWPILEELQ